MIVLLDHNVSLIVLKKLSVLTLTHNGADLAVRYRIRFANFTLTVVKYWKGLEGIGGKPEKSLVLVAGRRYS